MGVFANHEHLLNCYTQKIQGHPIWVFYLPRWDYVFKLLLCIWKHCRNWDSVYFHGSSTHLAPFMLYLCYVMKTCDTRNERWVHRCCFTTVQITPSCRLCCSKLELNSRIGKILFRFCTTSASLSVKNILFNNSREFLDQNQPVVTIRCFLLKLLVPEFYINSNKSPTWSNNFSLYYPGVCLQLNTLRAFSRPPSRAQWLQWQPLVLPSYRGDSYACQPASPTTKTARLSPWYEGKTRGCHWSRAPDDGRENARNMLSCKQTSGK